MKLKTLIFILGGMMLFTALNAYTVGELLWIGGDKGWKTLQVWLIGESERAPAKQPGQRGQREFPARSQGDGTETIIPFEELEEIK